TYNLFGKDEPVVKKRFTQRLFYALSTNLSPSLYDKSISMLSVSLGYQNDFVPTSLKETIQSQSVSDTKYAMPLSFGIQVQFPVNDRLSVGAGLSYSLLVSQYQKYSYNSRLDIQQNLHYLGIPVNAYYSLLQSNKLKFYLTAGLALEKGILANYRIVDNGIKKTENHSISGVQFSFSGGLGAEYKLNNDIGLYFDPSLAYYFKSNQPDNIRTVQRLQYKFELGMRFHL
ncbi:MAG: outer membrane beta-barrel protein, partial [Bacteroidales bacterium]